MWNRERPDRNALDRALADLNVKPEPPRAEPPPRVEPAPPVAPPPAAGADAKVDAAARKPAAPAPAAPPARGSTLGPTLRFKGDLVADEDLVVQGQLEGSILHSRSLTIGADGSMKGDIRARRIVVEGRVEGDLYALECVTVRATGHVRGSIYAPRVAIAEGAAFNGRVDMEKAPAVPAVPAMVPSRPEARPPAETPSVELGSVEIDALLEKPSP